MRLRGQFALITGGAKGIGKATALLFAREGASVAIVDNDFEAGKETERELVESGVTALFIDEDISKIERVQAIFELVGAKFGRLDVLVNNAAVHPVEGEPTIPISKWEHVHRTNLTAYLECAQAAVELMQDSGGSIVNVCSVHRLISDTVSIAYASAKAGVYQLTRSLAMKLASQNILVNSISPGYIRTSMSVVDGIDETATVKFKNHYLDSARIPLGRAGLAEEVAAVALFLASRECRYMTGADLVVDGGLTLTL